MKTIALPQKNIANLWGNCTKENNKVFRLMQYVLKEEVDENVLLHNVVTGHLVKLDSHEVDILNVLPMQYNSALDQLIDAHFLVPLDFNEYQLVVNLYNVLRKIRASWEEKSITHYTILPTSSCNARCYYCFEHGTKTSTMSDKTIDDVVKFIDANCGKKRKIRISWFGGEPTVASSHIDKICEGLIEKRIEFVSDMTTNGYLFDDWMINQAVHLWNLKNVMICLDGTELTYNKVKSYVNTKDSPYLRVMRNIGFLLENKIFIHIRMNFDLNNYHEFGDLVKEIDRRFHKNPLLRVSVHPVIGEHKDHDGIILHGNDEWFEEKTVELNDIIRNTSYFDEFDQLPSLNFTGCQASNNSSVTITPDGDLVKCPEQFGENQIIGNIRDGISNHNLVQSWKQLGHYEKCIKCTLFPACMKIENCGVKNYCSSYLELSKSFKSIIKTKFVNSKNHIIKEDINYDV